MSWNADEGRKHGTGEGDAVSSRFADDGFYRAMSARSRRRILYHLLDNETSTVRELATVLVSQDAVDRDATTPSERRARELELHHLHLPLLDDVGLVEHEPETSEVELVDVDPAVRDLIEDSIVAESY